MAVALAVSANSLANGFVNDDEYLILLNPWIRSAANLPTIFSSNSWAFAGVHTTTDYYRPVMHVVYLATFQLFGLRALGFHLVNLLLHAANTALVFLVAFRLASSLGELDGRSPSVEHHTALSIPWVAALLFATHPVHTDAVAWIAALPELAFTLSSLGLLALHASPAPWRGGRASAAVALLALALLSKETAVVIPALLLLHDRLARRARSVPRATALYVAYLVTTALYLVLRQSVVSKTFVRTPPPWDLTPSTLVAGVILLFEQYVQLVVAPFHLSWWHPFRPVFAIASPELLWALAIALLFAFGCRLAWRHDRLAAFSLGLFVIPLAPAFYASAVRGMPVAERYLYLPSVGLALLAGSLLARIARRRGGRIAALALLALLLPAYSLATIARNRVWKDSLTLYNDTARSHPDAPVPPLSLATELMNRGHLDEAIAQLRILVATSPRDAANHSTLGAAQLRRGQLEEAAVALESAIALDPRSLDAYNDLAVVRRRQGDPGAAVTLSRRALEIDPGSPGAHFNLGGALAEAGDAATAVHHYREAVRLRPEDAYYRSALAIELARQGALESALEQFEAAVRLAPDEPVYRRNLERARSLGNRGVPQSEPKPP